jgi:hypothetical protein
LLEAAKHGKCCDCSFKPRRTLSCPHRTSARRVHCTTLPARAHAIALRVLLSVGADATALSLARSHPQVARLFEDVLHVSLESDEGRTFPSAEQRDSRPRHLAPQPAPQVWTRRARGARSDAR